MVSLPVEQVSTRQLGERALSSEVGTDLTLVPSHADKLKNLMGKFGGSKDSKESAGSESKASSSDADDGEDADPDAPTVEDPFKDFGGDGSDAEATKAKLEELIRQAGAAQANSTIKLGVNTVMLERVPMSLDDKIESRKK